MHHNQPLTSQKHLGLSQLLQLSFQFLRNILHQNTALGISEKLQQTRINSELVTK
jgi:hypothetical protein